MNITITEATARRCMERMADWLEWVDSLDSETRADIIALDELVKVLDAESYLTERENARLEAAQRQFEERKAKEAAENDN